MVFAKDDLAVIVTCFTKKDGLVLGLQKNFQKEVIENLAEVKRLCQSQKDFKCVIYIIRFLTRITSSSGIQ